MCRGSELAALGAGLAAHAAAAAELFAVDAERLRPLGRRASGQGSVACWLGPTARWGRAEGTEKAWGRKEEALQLLRQRGGPAGLEEEFPGLFSDFSRISRGFPSEMM